MNDSIETLLDQALEVLSELGGTLQERPTIGDALGDLLGQPYFAFAAKAKSLNDTCGAKGELLFRQTLYERLGVVLSDAAATERGRKTVPAYLSSVHLADIVVSPQFFPLKTRTQRSLILHELWHLLEHERGVGDDVLISEGTATAAQVTAGYFKLPCTIENAPNSTYFLYHGAADLVLRRLGDKPLIDILDPAVRAPIEQEYTDIWRTHFSKIEVAPLRHPAARLAELLTVDAIRTYAEQPNHENLVALHRADGLVRVAEEISNQDTTLLRQYFSKALTAS